MVKNNQGGRINQCFYFDKALNKRLYIRLKITRAFVVGPTSLWLRRLEESTAATTELEYRNEIFLVCIGYGYDC